MLLKLSSEEVARWGEALPTEGSMQARALRWHSQEARDAGAGEWETTPRGLDCTLGAQCNPVGHFWKIALTSGTE